MRVFFTKSMFAHIRVYDVVLSLKLDTGPKFCNYFVSSSLRFLITHYPARKFGWGNNLCPLGRTLFGYKLLTTFRMRCRASLPLCFIFQSLLLFSQKTPKLLMFLLLPSLLPPPPPPTDRPTEPPGPTSQKDRRFPASSSFVLPPSPGQPSSKKEEEEEAVTRHKPGEILCQRDENLGPKVVEPGPHHFPGHMCSLKSVGGGGSPPPPLSPSIIFPTKKNRGQKK